MAEQQELISQYIDRSGIDQDTSYILNRLKQVNDAYDALNAKKVQINTASSTKEVITSTKEAQKATENLIKEKERLLKTDLQASRLATELARAKALEAKAAKENAAAALLEAKAVEQANKARGAKSASAPSPISTTNVSNLEAERAAAAKTGEVVSDLDRAQAEAAMSANEWANAQKKVTPELDKSKKSAAELARIEEQNVKIAVEEKLLATQRAAALKNQVREENAAKGSLEQRRAALIRLNAAYDNLSPQERASAAGLRHQRILSGLTTQIKELEVGSGRAQRNVGNYGGEVEKAAKKQQSFAKSLTNSLGPIRTLANILPGIGISGIFLLLGQAVEAAATAVQKAFSSFSKYNTQVKITQEVNLAAADSYGKQITTVESLTSVLNDNNASLDQKKRALGELIALDPAFLGGLTQANLKTKEGIDLINEYTAALKARAGVDAAKDVSETKRVEVEKLNAVKESLRQRLSSTKTNFDDLTEEELKFLSRTKTTVGRTAFTSDLFNAEVPKSDIRIMIQDVDKALKTAGDELTIAMDVLRTKLKSGPDIKLGIVEDLKNQISTLDKQIEKEVSPGKLQKFVALKEKLEQQLALLLGTDKTALKNPNIKFFADALKEQAAGFQKLSEIDVLQQQTRINAREKAAAIEKQITEGQTRIEIQNEISKLNAVRNQRNVSANALANAQIEFSQSVKEINQKAAFDLVKIEKDKESDILDIKGSSVKRQLDLDKQANKDTIALLDEIDDRKFQAAKKRFDKRSDSANTELADRLRTIEETEQAELKANERRFQKGKISEKQFIDERNRILKRGELDRLHATVDVQGQLIAAEIKYTEDIIALAKTRGEDVGDSERKLAQLKLEYQKNANSEALKNEQEYSAALQQILDQRKEAYKNLENQVLETITSVISATFDKRNIAIQAEIDQLEKKKEKEIEVANATISNEAEKADALTVINIRAQAQREALERKQRKIDAEKAKFEKVAAALKVAVDTFQKIAAIKAQAALLLANPVTAALAPLALAQIPIVLASSGLAIAGIAAQPVPKYARGTEDHPGGPAIVGDGGRKEFVVLPSGKSFVTPSTSTLLNLPKHAQVIPEDKLLDGMMRASMRGVPNMPMDENGYAKYMTEQLTRELRAVGNIVKNKRETHITGTHGGVMAMHKWGQSYMKYIDEQINF